MKTVTYSRKKIIEVLRTLNEIVVSLDHLGSASYDMTKRESLEALDDFVTRHRIFRKAARARAILSSAFSRKPGPEGMDELEREMMLTHDRGSRKDRQAAVLSSQILRAISSFAGSSSRFFSLPGLPA